MRPQDNLEQLYRKRYENLETIPRKDLWAGIAARLPEKENKKRIIPLWYRLAGVAAVLSLLALVGYNYFYSTSSPATKVVYFDIPQENREVNITSEEFEQNMFESGELLNYLRLNTLVRQNNQQVASSSSSSSEGYKYVAKSNTESIGKKENPSALNSDYQENEIGELSQEQFLLSEKPEVLLHPETEVANLESDLKDLRLEAQKEESIEDLNSKAAGEKRFQFRTTAAAVYFDNLGKGSPIDDQLAGNEGRGDISFSYGVAVAYKISNRLSIRSGINKVDLSYNTRDVSYGTAISAMAVENNDARAVTLASPVMGNINQNLGFVEVPVELKYGVIDKKFGLNIIGGASTLFLSENNVTLEAGAATTSFGEAGNLNNVSYSANMGVGLDYNISSKFQINVEPIFKYQINTFNNTSDVKPYYFGVYSGLSFKF